MNNKFYSIIFNKAKSIGNAFLATLQSFLLILYGILIFPIRFFAWALSSVAEFAMEWGASRKFSVFLYGLPSVVLILMFFMGVVGAFALDKYGLIRAYITEAKLAEQKGNTRAAQLFYERAIELGVRDSEILFEFARVAESNHEAARVAATMNYLAPSVGGGYGPAHLWAATRLLSKEKIELLDIAKAKDHLFFALQDDPKLHMADCLLGDIFLQENSYKNAIKHLSKSRLDAVPYRLKLARCFILLGEEGKAKEVASLLVPIAQRNFEKDVKNNKLRIEFAEASLLAGSSRKSIELLTEGLKLEDSQELRNALTLVLIKLADDLLVNEDGISSAFDLLSTALLNTPNELLIFDRFMKILTSSNESDVEKIEGFLESNIVNGSAVGVSHLVLGTYQLRVGKLKEGGEHLGQAFRLLPNGPIVANNFAWYLSKGEKADPERALEIMNVVIAEYPQNPEFRDTRGHALLELGRWREAIADFEIAINSVGNPTETHLGLARAYDAINLPSLAQKHRDSARKIQD